MKSKPVKILVVQTQLLADELAERLSAIGVASVPLESGLLHTGAGDALFAGRESGLVCLPEDEDQAREIDELCRGSSIDVLKFDHTLQLPEHDPTGRLVPVFTTVRPLEASLLKAELAQHDIDAVLSSDLAFGPSSSNLLPGYAEIKVLVGERDEQAAREIVAAARQQVLMPSKERENDDADPEDQEGSPWPTCPRCGARRMTACPICETSGTSFPRADRNFLTDQGNQDQLAVICTTCDEPWLPEFLRRCEWCGHDFGEGLVLEASPHNLIEEQFNRRAAIVFFSLSFLLLAVLIWFKYIGR